MKNFLFPKNFTIIESYLLSGCYQLETVDLPENLEVIKEGAFSSCRRLRSITFPITLRLIEQSAFNGNLLTNVEFKSSINDIEPKNFENNFDTNFIFPNNIHYPFEYKDDVSDTVSIEDEFPMHCFYNSRIKNIQLGNNIERIPAFAFYNSSIESINLDKVRYICPYSFYQCEHLIELTFSDNLVYISRYAFSGCINLETIIINSQRKIEVGIHAFENCHKLNIANIVSLMNDIPDSCFSCCNEFTNHVETSSSCIIIGSDSFRNFIGSIKLNEGLEIIKDSAFLNCSLPLITIPSTVKYIGDRSFLHCYELERIEIPSSVTFLGEGCFYSCEKLSYVIIGKNITELPSYAFYGWYSLTSVIILGKITRFKYCCFQSSIVSSAKVGSNCICEPYSFATEEMTLLDIGNNAILSINEIRSSKLNIVLNDNITFIDSLRSEFPINIYYVGMAKYNKQIYQTLYYFLNMNSETKIYVTPRYRDCTFCGLNVIHTNYNPFESQHISVLQLGRKLREIELPQKCIVNGYVTIYNVYFKRVHKLAFSLSFCSTLLIKHL